MSLVLPAPVNLSEADVLPVGNDAAANTNGAEEDSDLPESERLKKNIIFPPPEIRTLIDRTAGALHKSANPTQLETKIREGQKTDPKFSFLNSSDPYHTYYLFQKARLREGHIQDGAAPVVDGETGAGRTDGGNAGLLGTAKMARGIPEEMYKPKEPRTLEFVVDRPGLPAVDFDILKLTALFVARRGRSFLSSLSQREGRNVQFDFLRPTHSLYPLYNRMVQQYTRVLVPPSEALAELESGSQSIEGRKTALAQAKERAEWEKWRSERAKKKEEAQEERRIAFAQIDWQDFVVVETIEFTSADEQLELPPPSSITEMENMTLAQKRMASMVQEESEAFPVPPEERDADDMDMDESDNEEDKAMEQAKAKEQEIAKEVQRKFAESSSMKIKKDYVPKLLQTTAKPGYTLYKGQEIPNDQLSEHIRIELLDPKWRENKQALDQRKIQSGMLQSGADVSASLRELASARTDMFGSELDEAQRKVKEEEERARRREKEKIVWDGHTASKEKTLNRYATGASLDEQIAAIHRSHGLGATPANAVGPSVPPLAPAGPGPAAFPPAPGTAAAAPPSAPGTISAGPQGPTQYNPYGMPPPGSSLGAYPPPQLGYGSGPMPPSGAPPSIHPSRLAALAHQDQGGSASPDGSGAASPAGASSPNVRPREEEEGNGAGEPAAKRSRIQKLPEGMYHPEDAWLAANPFPVSIKLQLPSDIKGRPELDGSVVDLPPVGLKTTIGELREKIQEATKTSLPLSKMRIDLPGGRVLNNKSTLAELNLGEGDSLMLGVRK